MEVACYAGLAGGEIGWIVCDAEAVGFVGGDGFDGEGVLEKAGHAVVVSFGQDDGDADGFDPLAEDIEDMAAHAVLRVDEVSGDDEAGGVCSRNEEGESFQVRLAIAFRDGDATATEGGGFSKVDIGDY